MGQEIRPLVWISHKDDAPCASCGASLGRGEFIVIDRVRGMRCLGCAGLEGLVFLPSGDAALTRRAVAHSSRSAVVLRFSRARKRNERQGVLVEQAAIEKAESDNAQDEAQRETQRQKRRVRDAAAERTYSEAFAGRVLELFPGAPREAAETIAAHACQKHSGRVGRSAQAKAFAAEAVTLAVWAHVRHAHTDYDRLLAEGSEPAEVRAAVRPAIEQVMARWGASDLSRKSKRARPSSRRVP
ncbi:MAG TPA: DUF2293 domain-containing protein [Vicinamibacteria bacterium]|jgi:hypothetical protein|nr:DUF2293 domain-containing protein [Vicinamibacteria bacterium]